jgi:hypothetical protein
MPDYTKHLSNEELNKAYTSDSSDPSLLEYVCQYNRMSVLEQFLNYRIDSQLTTIFNLGVKYNHVHMVRRVLPMVKPNFRENVELALTSSCYDLVKLFLKDNRFDPSYDDNQLLRSLYKEAIHPSVGGNTYLLQTSYRTFVNMLLNRNEVSRSLSENEYKQNLRTHLSTVQQKQVMNKQEYREWVKTNRDHTKERKGARRRRLALEKSQGK